MLPRRSVSAVPGTPGAPPIKARRASRGRVLAVKWGMNPNSSSLGVDVTFLLFGLSIITVLTPLVGFLIRLPRRRLPAP